MNTRKEILEEKLARDGAEGAVHSFCVGHKAAGVQWFEQVDPQFEEEKVFTDEAIEYLALCGRIVRHPKRNWFRILPKKEGAR